MMADAAQSSSPKPARARAPLHAAYPVSRPVYITVSHQHPNLSNRMVPPVQSLQDCGCSRPWRAACYTAAQLHLHWKHPSDCTEPNNPIPQQLSSCCCRHPQPTSCMCHNVAPYTSPSSPANNTTTADHTHAAATRCPTPQCWQQPAHPHHLLLPHLTTTHRCKGILQPPKLHYISHTLLPATTAPHQHTTCSTCAHPHTHTLQQHYKLPSCAISADTSTAPHQSRHLQHMCTPANPYTE
jgi:hypothetical protein